MNTSSAAQERFQNASRNYEAIKKDIREMCVIINNMGRPVRFDDSMAQLDCIVQASLLTSAIADEFYAHTEHEFIKGITEYADLTSAFNERAQELGAEIPDITWESLKELIIEADQEKKAEIVALICAVVSGKTVDFILEFAPVDVITEKNYLESIVKNIRMMIAAFSEVDGDTLTGDDENNDAFRETGMGVLILDKLLTERWLERVEDFKAFVKNKRNNGNNGNGEGGGEE